MRFGVDNPEHVADHMYMMAIMTLFIQDDHNLNKERYIITMLLKFSIKIYISFNRVQFHFVCCHV